jgi:hypothetical protein
MRSAVLSAGFALAALGCADLTSGTTNGVGSHDVTITASVRGHNQIGDSVTFHIANAGTDAAYISRCGSEPLLLAQQFVDGAWTGGVENFMCMAPSEPGPVVVPAGGSIDIIRFFQQGQYRMIVAVAGKLDLSDATQALSNVFDAP